MKKCLKCGAIMKNRITIEGKTKNISKRKYCIDCSPFGLHNTSQLCNKVGVKDGHKFCNRCKTAKPLSSFYIRRTEKGFTAYCKSCSVEQAVSRQKQLKKDAVTYKGGKCKICGYNKCMAALEFHHIDRSKKDFSLGQFKTTKINSKIYEELDKCILLCCLCHREVEAGIIKCPYEDSNLE